jgi:hypothetical protein
MYMFVSVFGYAFCLREYTCLNFCMYALVFSPRRKPERFLFIHTSVPSSMHEHNTYRHGLDWSHSAPASIHRPCNPGRYCFSLARRCLRYWSLFPTIFLSLVPLSLCLSSPRCLPPLPQSLVLPVLSPLSPSPVLIVFSLVSSALVNSEII